jgi:general stress protein 26
MKSALLALSLALLLIAFSGTSVYGQDASREKLIAAARETMAAARYCALITSDSSGHPLARTLDPFPPDKNMVVWLGTNPRSRKVAAIRRNPRVTLYYFDREAQAYVTIAGLARLVNDPKSKAKWWKDEWSAFYHNRKKDYLLISVTPLRMEVVNVTKGIVGDPQTWKPPSVTFRKVK